MKALVVLLVLGLMMVGVVLTSGAASAQQYPQVASLEPFSPSANYMSLAGYLRWQVFVEQGTWISYEEAKTIVAQQQ
jgi:hypothetical protein